MLCFAWLLLLLFSCSVVSNSLRPHGLQHARLPCPSLFPRVYSNSSLLSWWCHPTITSSVTPFPPALNPSQHRGLFHRVGSLYQVAKVLGLQLQHHSFQWIFRFCLWLVSYTLYLHVLLPLAEDGIKDDGLGHFRSYSVFLGISHVYRRHILLQFESFPQLNLSFITEGSEPRT